MTPDQLITFSVVAEHGNISQAARAMHLSQPAVSGQLQALQQSFGDALYRRQGRGIALTPAGLRLLAAAVGVRAAMQQAIDERQAHQAVTAGHLRIGASTTPASYLLPEVVARFKQKHPAVQLQMIAGNTGEIIAKLGELDLAIVEGQLSEVTRKNNLVRAWQTDEVVAIVPPTHHLARRAAVTLAELAREPLVMREQGSGVRNLVMQAFAQAELTISGYLELAGVEGIKQAVRAGLGIGFVSRLSLGHDDGALKGVRIGSGLMRAIHIVLPARLKPSRVTEAFLQEHQHKE